MKRRKQTEGLITALTLLALITSLSIPAAAQSANPPETAPAKTAPAETAPPRDGLAGGSIVTMESFKSGGGGSFSFPLLRAAEGTVKKGGTALSIRNELMIHGYGTHAEEQPAGIAAVTNKILLGGLSRRNRMYTFVEGGIGVWGQGAGDASTGESAEAKRPFQPAEPLFWEFKGGGGMEIYTTGSTSFYMEIGGGLSGLTPGEPVNPGLGSGFAHMAAGFRSYF